MADNVAITAGSGTTVAADEVADGTLGTVKVQYVKLMDGTLDGTNKVAVTSGGALKVDLVANTANSTAVKVDGSAVTQPVSGTVTATVSGTVTANPTAATPVLKNGLTNSPSAVVQSVAATLKSYYIYNPNTSVAYVQVFDVATAAATTAGTTTPKWSIAVPPGSAANLSGVNLSFANGIQVAATTTATGLTANTTALDCNFGYS